MATVEELGKPPVDQEVIAAYVVPTWAQLGKDLLGGGPSVDREYVPELRWPNSVRTFERMFTDTQLSGLFRGTTLPIRRYVWGLDPNGATPQLIADVQRDFNMQAIADAMKAHDTGVGAPVPRARNSFTLDRHLADAMAAMRFGNRLFDLYGEIGDDGRWHPLKISAIANWTVGQIRQNAYGELLWIKQLTGGAPMIESSRLVPYILDPEPGDWVGRSSFRSCYREWLLKDRLLRVDLRNQENAGGVLINISPPDATDAERRALGEMAAAFRAGGGGSVPDGTQPMFIRAQGQDAIASIDRHDAAMAREFLMMFMSLGTNSQSGNRALGGAFINWFSIAQEALAQWLCDVFNESILERYAVWNYGDTVEFVPKLTFKRPEDDNPVADLTNAATTQPGTPGAAAVVDQGGNVLEQAHTRSMPGAIVVDDETRHMLVAAYHEYEQWARPTPRRARRDHVHAAQTPFRRQPNANEVRAATDFNELDSNWKSAVAQLVAEWQEIRKRQIGQLAEQVVQADGDLGKLATISATAAGGDLIAARLKAMLAKGASEAHGEATRQGVVAPETPDLAVAERDLASRASALEQLLASALSQAGANKAVQLTGGGLTAGDVAAQVRTHLSGLSDAYLTDQFGGAMSAAQNAGRLAVMDANQPERLYASELLDQNTCEPCAEEDGAEFATPEEAAAAYPGGGYVGCLGGPRCRGTVVAVYSESAPSQGDNT